MKKVARAGFMVLGAPNLISFAVVTVVVWILAPAIPVGTKRLCYAAQAVGGFLSIFVGAFLARLVGFQAGFCVSGFCISAAIAAWFSIHFITVNGLAALRRTAAGVLLGWLCKVAVGF